MIGNRPVRVAALVGLALVGVVGVLGAQITPIGKKTAPPPDSASLEQYKAQRAKALHDISEDQKKLDELRRQRAELESRLARASAAAAEERAKALLLSDETSALRGLDSLLTVAQSNLTAQRDRFLGLGDAVRRRAAGELVVLVRADSAGGIPHLDSLRVAIDSASGDVRRYSERANVALGEGAVDEVYRSHILPTTHDVVMIASVSGSPAAATQSATVAVSTGSTTYVEFTLRGAQWTESTWTKSSAAP
jgi:hypothetical protein